MRTTLDIDDDVLAAAKERAKADGATAGKVLSALARSAINGAGSVAEYRNGLQLLPSAGNLVTSEQVYKMLDEMK